MKLKLRSEGTPINSEIYAESLAGTEGYGTIGWPEGVIVPDVAKAWCH
jgi:hypothetical protein